MKVNQIALVLLTCGFIFPFSNAQTSTETTINPEVFLQRGLYLSDLYNWVAARPYLIRAKQLFESSGDTRNALYAELAVIRAGAEPASLPELSYKLTQELATNPILQSDKKLRMFCLTVKGELDGEVDSAAMRRDWNEVSALAQ